MATILFYVVSFRNLSSTVSAQTYTHKHEIISGGFKWPLKAPCTPLILADITCYCHCLYNLQYFLESKYIQHQVTKYEIKGLNSADISYLLNMKVGDRVDQHGHRRTNFFIPFLSIILSQSTTTLSSQDDYGIAPDRGETWVSQVRTEWTPLYPGLSRKIPLYTHCPSIINYSFHPQKCF